MSPPLYYNCVHNSCTYLQPIRSNSGMTSLASDPQAAAHVQSCLKDLYKLVKNVEDARNISEPTLVSITATHKKVETEQKVTPTNKARLKTLYDEAIKDSSKVNSAIMFLLYS